MNKLNCILLIDDDEADNEYHSIIINEANVCNQIKVVTDGLLAIEYINYTGDNQSHPRADLIFLDMNMPGMNGFEFLEEYEKLDPSLKSKVIVIMLAVSLNHDDRLRILNTGEVIKFENKPLTVEAVKEIAEKYFSYHQA